MAGRYILLAALLALAWSNVVGLKTENGRIHITMGTASGCSNAVNFIRNQLVPTYELYGEFMDIEFVPWGRTVRNPDGSMTCQFGVNDCWANRLHRCVLNRLEGNTLQKLRYIACEFQPPFPAFRSRSFECVESVGLDVDELQFCVDNPQLDTLDENAQAAAAEPMRIINWVPFVVFNREIVPQAHWSAHSMLRPMICQALLDDPNTPIRSC